MSFTVTSLYHETLFITQLNGMIANRPVFTYTDTVPLFVFQTYTDTPFCLAN